MRNAKTSKAMALVVLLMLVILCLSAFSFASSATSGVAENSTGVMGDVISNSNNTANARASSSNIAEFTFRYGSTDYLTVKYPKKITIILGDEIGANTSNSPRTSGMYNIDSQTNEQPNLVLEGHFGDAGNSDYQQIIRTGVWGFNGLNGNTLFNEYFSNYDFHTERNNYRGGGAVGSVGGDGVQFAVNTWDEAENNWVLCINNSGNYDGLDTVVWPQGTAKKAGMAVYTMPTGNNIVNFRQFEGFWGKSWESKYSDNTYPVSTPTITINVLDPEGLQSVIKDAQNRKNNAKGVVEKALITTLNNAIAEANNWVTKARDYTQNFDISQETLELAKNNVTKAIEAIENSQSFGVVNGGQYCTSTELRISKATYDAAGSSYIAYVDGVTNKIYAKDFTWKPDAKYEGDGYYYYTYTNNSNKIENKSVTFTIVSTGQNIQFNITSWHGFADSSGNILSDLSKDSVLQNGQLITCVNTSHTCRLKVNSLDNGQKIQCQHTWNKADIESKTELWAHTYGEEQTTPSTCITKGERYRTCTCGHKEVLGSLELDPNNHASLNESKLVWVAGQKVPGTETELTEAMHCGYAGKYGHLCSACNKYANEVEKPAGIGANDEPIEHVADTSNAHEDTPPTCCEYGTGHYNCQNCGLKARDLTEEEIKQESKLQPTNNHVWKSDYFIEKEPTCTENAVVYFQCSNEKCTATTTDGIDFETDINVKALGHDMHFEILTDATCYSPGYQIEKCHRDGCKATGREEQIPTKEHEIDREHKHNEIAPTCKDDGSYEYRCKWYDGVNCTEKEVITAETDDSLVANGEHTRPSDGAPGYLEITNHPTCTKNGEGYYICTVCQTHVQLDPANEPKLQAKGHTWADVSEETYIKTPADCTNAAVYYKSCSVCKEKHASETFVHGNPLGHTWENIAEEQYIKTKADCTNAAVYYKTCSVCKGKDENETFEHGEPLGHNWIFTTVDEPTCYSEGSGKDICATCKAEGELKPIAKIDHVYDESIKHNEIAKTCTKDGSYEFHCKNHELCGAVKTITAADDETLKATGHDVEGQNIVVTKAPTCHSLGEGYRVCKNCSEHIDVEPSEAGNFAELAKKDHEYNTSDIKDMVAPTCTKNGSAKYYCKEHANGCTATQDVTPTKENGLLAIGHNYDGAKLNVDKVANCMEEGLGHKYCINPKCDDYEGSKKEEIIQKDNKNHVFDESKGSKRLHKDDVCTNSTGCYDYLTCANPACSGVKGATQIIEDTIKPGTIHKQYVEKVDNKYQKSPATCESPATYYKSCSACGEKHESATFVNGEALGHSFTKYVSNENATCHSNATETAKCERCDKTDTREIPNSTLSHKWEFTEKVEPSLEHETDGYDLYTCSLCKKTKQENIVKWETLIPEPEPPKFTVTIEGGTANGLTTVQVNANGTVTVKANVPEGKRFVGWSDGDKIISYKAEDTIEVTGDMTLTAVFDDVVQDGQGANNSAVIGSAIGGTVVGLLVIGIIIAVVVIVKKRKA